MFASRRKLVLLVAALCALAVAATATALTLTPPNDLLALGQGQGQTPASAPLQDNPEPPNVPTPKIACGPGSNSISGLDDGVDGRVPSGAINSPRAKNGFTCNLALIGHQGSSGGFKVFRYIDNQGHECAFYDTALLYPTNAISITGPPSTGVAVLDMTDPYHPVQTATLSDPVMRSPHESLSLNVKRGLLAADLGNPATYPGLVSMYSVNQDCRHPVLDFTAPLARFGHEGNFSPDGTIFYAAGTGSNTVTAIDVTNPTQPHVLWLGDIGSHGLTISDDGNRAFLADAVNSQLTILDTSQIQAHKPNPQTSEVSRLTWSNVTIPQNAMPMTIKGHHYLLEFDEYAFRFNSAAPPDTVGAGRIINIDNERHPYIVSNLRLQVNQPAEHHAAASGDPGTMDPAQGYAAHYCGIPREVNPEIAACSFISSGLRVFDIRDPLHPKEIGYFVSPPTPNTENGGDKSNFAMSKPAFAPERREIWYSDGTSGLYVLRVPANLWPSPGAVPGQSCLAASGRLHGRHLGPVALGERRAKLRKQLPSFATRNRRSWDFFCLAGGGVRAAYRHNRVVWALTSNKRYRFDGVRPGARLAAVAKRLHVGRGYKVGLNTWYIVPGPGANGIFKVRHGRIQEIGIINKALTSRRSSARALLRSLP